MEPTRRKGEQPCSLRTLRPIRRTCTRTAGTRTPRERDERHLTQIHQRETHAPAPGNPAPRFRQWAEDLLPKIENARRPMTQNPTPKRNAQYQDRLHDSRNLMRTRAALLALADAHDAGTCPAELASLRSRNEIAPLVRKWLESPSYYARKEADDFADKTPAARALQAMISEHPQAQTSRETKIEEAEAAVKLVTIPGYFPTPAPLIEMMLEVAEIEPGCTVLEPSAGGGAIADALKAAHPDAVLDVCEINPQLAALLKLKGYNWIHQYPDFLTMPASDTFRYDRILMNPPFENQADIDHVSEAYNHLADDGVLVAIMSPSFEYRENSKSAEFRKWLDEVGANWMEIPAGAFKLSGTQVATRLMIIDKRER